MPVPWLQIVQLVPSILDVSRELLRRTRTLPPPPIEPLPSDNDDLRAHVLRLEENERRQAELVNQMAEQIVSLSKAVTVLHQRVIWLTTGLSVAIVMAVVALVK